MISDDNDHGDKSDGHNDYNDCDDDVDHMTFDLRSLTILSMSPTGFDSFHNSFNVMDAMLGITGKNERKMLENNNQLPLFMPLIREGHIT